MAERLTPDICVIGAGAAGLTVAAAAAQFGVEVVLLEKGEMGGDCLNYGCVPSKALIAAARQAHGIVNAERFGMAAEPPRIDFGAVRSHVRGAIAAIEPNDSEERFTGLGVRVIRAPARFVSPDEVVAGDIRIAARRFVVASGSGPAVPPIDGLGTVAYLTNETIFDLAELPEHLVIVGAGAIGLELGQAFRRLGSSVTVLEALRPLHHEDPELAEVVVERLTAEGMVIHAGAAVDRVEPGTDGVRVHLAGDDAGTVVEGSHLLVATGRTPTVDGLGLAEAGIDHDRSGIAVGRDLRTSNRRVYAVGDVVAGAPKHTHVGAHHAGQVIRAILFRLPINATAAAIPRATFTDPEIAAVGLDEAAAREKYGSVVKVLRWPYADNDRARTELETAGFIKLITGRGGRILGVGIVGHGAAEMINVWALALQQKAGIGSFAGLVMPYPTYAEIGKRAALTAYRDSLTNPWLRRIIRLLARLG